jgi:hypothetical protein
MAQSMPHKIADKQQRRRPDILGCEREPGVWLAHAKRMISAVGELRLNNRHSLLSILDYDSFIRHGEWSLTSPACPTRASTDSVREMSY